MKLERFKERNNKVIVVGLFTIICILLIGSVVFYKTFASFEIHKNFNIIHGSIEDAGNLYFAFYVDNKIQENMPEKGNEYYFNSSESYCAVNGVKDESIIPWFDQDSWAVTVTGLKTSRTKCNLYFEKGENLLEKINSLPLQIENNGENGLYRVTHENANITYTDDVEKQNILKQDELRYAGNDPNNYVWFNHELWRMIGLVNTPEGKRIKIIRNDSIGRYSWDSSESEINAGNGFNEWSQSDIMKLLNPGYEYNYDEKSNMLVNNSLYWNGMNGKCIFFVNNFSDCQFDYGLKSSSSLIDFITWNYGSNSSDLYTVGNTYQSYDFERSNNSRKGCTSGEMCDESSINTYYSQGRIGLLYLSDYGYATSGGTYGRDECLSVDMYQFDEASYQSCLKNNWLLPMDEGEYYWSMIPMSTTTNSNNVFVVRYDGKVYGGGVIGAGSIKPVLYLKKDTMVLSDNIGTKDKPYILA